MHKELLELYNNSSKHSGYQILPQVLHDRIGENVQQHIARFELERMNYLKQHISFENKKVLDIGGNTGYFSFESLEAGAKEVIYIEGNSAHEKFVKRAAEVLQKNIATFNHYLEFNQEPPMAPYDVVLLFNVIHHFGDDFGDSSTSMLQAKHKMCEAIQYFSNHTNYLVLQMGFCWKGDRNLLLFEGGTKKEMIDFVKEAIQDHFGIVSIGVAEEVNGKTIYNECNENNMERNDRIGEFRNRPIFILKKLK